VASGPLSATFPTLGKPIAKQLVCNFIFLNKFLRSYVKMLPINVDSANVTCTTASLPRPMLTTKLFTIHFAMVGFRKLLVV